MSRSTLNRPAEGHLHTDAIARPDPYAGTLLGQYDAEFRSMILRSLDHDRNPENDLPDATDDRNTTASEPFSLETYPEPLRKEILSRHAIDFDDAVYPHLPGDKEQRRSDEEAAARLRAYLTSMNPNR